MYTDLRLVIGVLLLQLPIVVALIAKAALFRARLEQTNQLMADVSD